MFGVPKHELLKHLENLRLRLCCYSPQPTCDCKYGIPWDKDKPMVILNQWQDFSRVGEHTGCPELRQAIALINTIPESMFKD